MSQGGLAPWWHCGEVALHQSGMRRGRLGQSLPDMASEVSPGQVGRPRHIRPGKMRQPGKYL